MKLLVMVVSSYHQNNSFSLTTSFILMLYFCLVFRISSESQTTNQCCWRCWRKNSNNSCKCDTFPVCLLHIQYLWGNSSTFRLPSLTASVHVASEILTLYQIYQKCDFSFLPVHDPRMT